LPTGAPIRTCSISNDSAGYAQLLSWAFEHAPGPRLVMSIEGTRSYGAGLARAAAVAGFTVIECEQPTRTRRRGKGKSDPIDAHLAVLTALQLNADRLPTPRADGDREALRILLRARQELTTTSTAQTNRLRALLRDGDDTDRRLALATLARRRQPQTPAATNPYARPRSAAWPWHCARPPARLKPTAPSWLRSSTTWSLG
jgi:transposase